MNWGSHALVLEPESLREEIRTEAQAMQEKYSKADEELEKSVRA
jgi:predicted DNA-binding transcriptional regulator YafY